MSAVLLRKVVRSLLLREHSEHVVAPTLRAALSGDAESWNVLLDMIEETRSNARFRLQKEGKKDLIQRLAIVHDVFPKTGVLSHSQRFDGLLTSQRKPTSFSIDSDLDFTDIGGDDEREKGIFALNWVGWPSHVVAFSNERTFVFFKEPITEFWISDLPGEEELRVTKLIKNKNQTIWAVDGRYNTREALFYPTNEPYSNGTPDWWSKESYDMLHDIISSYERSAKNIWTVIDAATKMPEETAR